jgi:predicted amidohydrolase
VIADGGESGGVVIAEVDPAKVEEARAMVPALRHDRPLRSPKPASVGRASG